MCKNNCVKCNKILEEIKERFDKATKGPWKDGGYCIEDINGTPVLYPTINEEIGAKKDDYEFIINAITDIEYLLKELEELRNGL